MPPLLLRRILCVLGILLLVSLAFGLGLKIGERKARHFSQWYENYGRRPIRGPGRPELAPSRNPMMKPSLPSSHGVSGAVVSVSDRTFTIQAKDGSEQVVSITSSTIMRLGRDTLRWEEASSTHFENFDVAVFGTPAADGHIEATLIRLFPRPPSR